MLSREFLGFILLIIFLVLDFRIIKNGQKEQSFDFLSVLIFVYQAQFRCWRTPLLRHLSIKLH